MFGTNFTRPDISEEEYCRRLKELLPDEENIFLETKHEDLEAKTASLTLQDPPENLKVLKDNIKLSKTGPSWGDDRSKKTSSENMIKSHFTLQDKNCDKREHPQQMDSGILSAEQAEKSALEKAGNMEQFAWPASNLPIGGQSAKGEAFAPWNLVKEYPNMFVGKRNSERAAPFFDIANIHQHQVWDLFYIHEPGEPQKKAVLLVPTVQFQHLLDVVNKKLDTFLTIPLGLNGLRFQLYFGLGNTPRPRFLGRSTSRETFCHLEQNVPHPDPNELDGVSPLAVDDFIHRMQEIRSAGGGGSGGGGKRKTEKNRIKRAQSHRAWGRSIKRMQRYLGIRKQASGPKTAFPAAIGHFDPRQNTMSQPEESVLLVSIDVEAYEFNQDIITEVGIAILDTLEIQNTPPGSRGEGWRPFIHGKHFRIKENAWARNVRHVVGCADNFNFGSSQFVKKNDMVSELSNIVGVQASAGISSCQGTSAADVKRSIVLVFHDHQQDAKYLKTLGYNIYKVENILEIVDTKDIYQYCTRALNSSSLGTVLNSLEISHRFLHNAGNDAVYTMQALIGLVIKKRLESIQNAPNKKNPNAILYADFQEEDEGWSSGGENSDGGNPLKLVDPDPGIEESNGWMKPKQRPVKW